MDDYDRRKDLCKDIDLLSKSEKEELYRILRREGGEFSENSNGIFFDIAGLPAQVFEALEKFIKFCKTNAKELEERSNVMNSMTYSTAKP